MPGSHHPAVAPAAGAMPTARMAVVCLALLLEGMSSSSINVQVSAISLDLRIDGTALQLVASAFLVAYAGLLPVAGRLVDAWSRRTVFLIGVALFGVGCLLCAAALSAPMLIAGRIVQGAGAALSAPAALALITAGLDEGPARNKAVALYGAMGAVGFSLGLVLPGAVVAWWGWRWSFVVFVPVVLLVLLATWSIQASKPVRRSGIDPVGAVVVTLVLVLAMHAVGGIGSSTGLLIALEAAAVLVGVAWLSRRPGGAGFPAEVVRSPRVRAACLGLAAVFAGVVASMYVLSLGLGTGYGHSGLVVGLLILPQPLFFSGLAGLGARLVTIARPTAVFACGSLLLVASLGYLALMSPSLPIAVRVLPAMAGIGAALALCFPAASIAAVDAAPPELRGTTAGLLTTAQNVGGAVGLAVVTASAVVPAVSKETQLAPGMYVSAAAVLLGVAIAGLLAAAGRRAAVTA
ncbi:MFS transporter [Nakamurella lactea]|uniref:MFS transporter n=1 Tax=Nakamurella lactea TaxID=459515 RepID=UPI000A06E7D7|nr:MFS transporter [Nakamurella lactea]